MTTSICRIYLKDEKVEHLIGHLSVILDMVSKDCDPMICKILKIPGKPGEESIYVNSTVVLGISCYNCIALQV